MARRKKDYAEVTPMSNDNWEIESAAGDAAREHVRMVSSGKKAKMRAMMKRHKAELMDCIKGK